MSSATAVEKTDWVAGVLANAQSLPPHSYGFQLRNSPSSLGLHSPKRARPIMQPLSDEDLDRMVYGYWEGRHAERQPAFHRACAWVIEALLRARKSGLQKNLNHNITLPRNARKLFKYLQNIGEREDFKPVCNLDVERRYRKELCKEDRAKLTMRLHWQLVAKAVRHLVRTGVFWWHDGDWFVQVSAADKVRKLRKRQVIVRHRTPAA